MKHPRKTKRLISASAALVDAAKRDIKNHTRESDIEYIKETITMCLNELQPACWDLHELISAMEESQNNYDLQVMELSYHRDIGIDVCTELEGILAGIK